MKVHSLESSYSLLDLAAVQERTAEMLAEAVPEAERAGRTGAAERMWILVHRCRVHAEVLRAQVTEHGRVVT